MSGVGLTGKIVPLNGGNFPVFEDINGQGGYRTVTDITARNLLVSASLLFLKEGMAVYVQSTSCLYLLQADLITWNIIANNGLGKQAAWFVDAAAGNDNNDGKTSLTALASTSELSRRCFPGGQALEIFQDVTVNIAAGSYSKVYFNVISYEPVTIFNWNVICAITSTAAMVLTNVISQSGQTNTRGEVVVSSGAFTAKERIRATTGANAGTMCYSTGLTSATDSFTSTWCKPTFTNFHSAPQPVIGDSVVVDTLTVTLNRVECYASESARITVNDAKITRIAVTGGSNSATGSTDVGGNVMYAGCQLTSVGGEITTTAGAYLCACRIPAAGRIAAAGFGWNVIALTIQGVLRIAGHVQTQGLTIDGGNVEVGTTDGTIGDSSFGSLTVFGDFGARSSGIEVQNGNGVLGATFGAVNVYNGSKLLFEGPNGAFWGGSTPGAIGIQILSGGWVYVTNNGNLFTITLKASATNPIRMMGISMAYPVGPAVLSNDNCGITLVGPVVTSITEGSLYLTNQNANISSTAFISSPVPGLYKFAGYIAVTTADAAAVGSPVLNAIFVDDSGITRTVPVATGGPLTTLGGIGGSADIEVGSGSINYSITGIVTPGTSKFSVRERCSLQSLGL